MITESELIKIIICSISAGFVLGLVSVFYFKKIKRKKESYNIKWDN